LAVDESSDHLFLHSPFARLCWGILNLDIPNDASLLAVVSVLRVQLNSEFFMVAVFSRAGRFGHQETD